MDDNQDSRASDAAATRKRRSSILKSQRPARTPFSELEFNVATPTDTAKSRRVSFSRRTGVAEFVTNEATTTWKNFYEEHNKSLESSGNDSDVNAARQPVEHLGRRIFDQQFEVEAVDLIGTITPTHSVHINFTEQITPTDYTADGKLTAPNNKFDFSALTDQQTKLFGNDFTVTGLGELSGKINFDFSNMGRIGDKDDLDEINKDLKRVSTNAVEVQADLRRDRHNVSEYIEVNLNTTHGAKDDDCDMSITDTIHSPKVQDVSRSSVDRKVNLNKDWMTDKENIAVNPYVAPVETDNFVINDEPDQVLVFDGKRVTLQTEKPEQDFGQTSRPHTKTKTPVRKTIVLNTNDDLPNFIDDVKIKSDESRTSTSFRDQSVCVKAVHKVNITKRSTANSSTDNISITQSLPTNIITSSPEKLKSMIHKESGQGNISITQSLNEKSFTATSKQIDRRRTVVHGNESANMSVTRALPTNIIINDKVEKHKTIMFDEDKGNISLTQGISSQFVIDHAIKERRKTIVFDDDEANISITQALPSQVLLDNKGQEKRKTVLFDDDSYNISITHALSSNIVLESCPEKRQTLLFEDNTGDISITQAAPSNLILTGKPEATERRRTILYEDDTGNISVTQAIPQNIILSKTLLKEDTQIFDAGNISLTEVLPTNIILKENRNDKRKTIVYDDDTGNVSITQAIPSQLIPGIANIEGVTTSNIQLLKPTTDSSLIIDNKCKTIVYDTEAADISITEAIPANIMIPNQEQDFFEDATCDIPSKQEVPANVFLLEGMTSNSHERAPIIKDTKEPVQHEIIKNVSENQDNVKYVEKRRTVIIANENGDDEMSITEAVPKIQNLIQETNKMLDFDVDKGNLSLTKPIPDQLTELYTDIINKSLKKDTSLSVQTSFCKPNVKVAVYQSMTIDTSEQIDLNTEPAVCNSISTTPSKVEEVTNVIESSMSSKDYVGNVVESKLDVYDIKMDALDEAEGATENDINVIKSEDIQSVSYDPKLKESKTSVLHTLLDMSEPIKLGVTDTYAETDNKSLSVVTEPEPEKDSSMIYFTIAEDEGIQTDKLETDASETDKDAESTENESDNFRLIRDSPMSIVSKEQSQNFGNTLAELVDKRIEIPEEKLSEVSSREDRYDEKIRPKSLKEANDTAELLDLISDFTDNNRSTSREVIPLVDARHVPVENKAEMHEPRRLSFATKRQSIIISREDLLNNISMAQAVLQKSRVEFEDCNLGEENQDSYVEEVTNSRRRSDRLSNEVVKTLHFDDESMSENSLKSDGSKIWPLRKVVTGESSPSVDKANVIPSYLKDVSDDIKQLMFDLVKPRSDAIPFENQEERLKRTMSTVSTQIQANLITSSQIDVDAELSSSRGSHENLENVPSDPSQDSVMEMANSREMPSQLELVPTRFHEPPCSGNTVPGNVLVFDHENPLNNIRLGPLDYVHAHDYKPIASTVALDNIKIKSDETLCGSEQSRCCQINMDSEINSTSSDIVRLGMKSTEVNTEPCVTQYRVAIREDKTLLPMCESILLDKAVHAQSKVGDTQVNTVIAMKQNKELLETSSSLTLIDDNLSKSITSSDSKTTSSNYYIARKERRTSLKSPVKSREGSAINSMDDDSYSALSKGKKRGHTPVTPSRRASVEVTPKPNSKVLKRSSSPNQNRILLRMSHESTKMRAERDTEEKEHVTNHSEDKAKNKKKIPNRNYGNTITIQQLITEYKIDADINKEILDVLKDTKYCESDSTEAPSQSDSTSDAVNEVSSFTSSKNLGDSEAPTSLKSQSTTDNTECSRIDWHPELSNLSSNKTVSYFDSGSNIVSKIDMLPFMGSYECERECSSADTWSFRLLHGRIRLTIRLAHRHDNATRTRVRADTPVTDITVDTIEYDKKNPVAILCIRFACETMRYMVSSRTETTYLARDVPLLLRRCAAVARVALRWGRAMHDAKLHLAYTLDTEGHLTLKVANIPLRSVWEVSMDLELVVEHPSQAPWPRAGNVSVHRVVSDVPVCDEDIHKVLKHTPNDWGHAPKTLWRMFRYLKNKQHDDDVILGV